MNLIYLKLSKLTLFISSIKSINFNLQQFFKNNSLNALENSLISLQTIQKLSKIILNTEKIRFMANQQKIRLVDCFFQPSEVFSLYDYTKIIYPIDGYICIRQICTSDSQPTFIKLEHEYEKIHSVVTYPNLIATLEENSVKQFSLGFYDSIHFHIKLGSSLAEEFKRYLDSQKNEYMMTKKLQFKVKKSNDLIFVLFSLKNQSQFNPIKDFNKGLKKETISLINPQGNDNQLFVVNAKSKRIVGKSYFSGNVKELVVKSNQEFSILQEDSSIAEYNLIENFLGQQLSESLKITKKRDIDFIHSNTKSRGNILSHLWLKQELVVMNSSHDQICVYADNKKAQSISMQSIKNFKLFCPLMYGFLVCNENFMFVFKKIEFEYICIAQFFIRQVGFSPELILSPQEDMLTYYMDSSKAIRYIKNFNDQIEAQAKSPNKMAKELKISGSIEFKRTSDLRIDVNKKNNTFAVSHQSVIQLYTINNFQLYLEQSLESQESATTSPVTKGRLKRQNTLGAVQSFIQKMAKQETIYKVAIHPYSETIAIAIKSKVRLYQILYNELFHIKDISVSNCNQLFFSNSGQFLSIVVSGKNGSKCYVYKTNEDYQLLECLSIGKKIEKFVWSKYDNFLYGVHSSGYYRWAIENGMKTRLQTLFDISFRVVDAVLNDKRDMVLLYGQNHILQINAKMDKENEINPKDVIKIQRKINQIVYQNGSYFLNLSEESMGIAQRIIKCDQISKIQSLINELLLPTSQILSHSKPLTSYQQTNGQSHHHRMIVCSGDSKRNIIMLVEEETKNIKILQWGKTSGLETKLNNNNDLIKIDRKNLKKLFKKYTKYEEEVKALQENLHQTIEQMREDLADRQRQREQAFVRQIKASQLKYEHIKIQKQKLEHSIEEKIQKHEEQTIKQVKQLQKIYERKIAITTNKLLTSEEMNYRNMLLAEENLKKLQYEANNDVEKIREEYKRLLADYMNEKDNMADQTLRMKKEYESRLYDLELENQRILEQYQSKTEDNIQLLKRNLVNEEIKLSETLSKKDNIQKSLQQALVTVQILKEKMNFLEGKNREANKKSQYLLIDIKKYQKILQQKNVSIGIYEDRINDLEKSNQILKYRVVELKGQNEPQSEENQKLKENLNQLETEYDKIVKTAFEKEQMFSIVKKESQKSKETAQKLQHKIKKLQKSYLQLLDRVMNITKAPIQDLRKQLINLLNTTKQDEKYLNRPTSSYVSNQSPLGELNRIREHLQVCLHEAIDSNKKGQQQKKVDLLKKNRQNSELIKEINDLRRKVRDFEGIVKEKDLQINRLLRGDPITINDFKSQSFKQNSRPQMTEAQDDQNETEFISLNNYQLNQKLPSRSQTRKQTRETKESFFDKSLFKSSAHWREKRLRTEQSHYRHVQTRSVKRNTSGKFLQIQNRPGHEEMDDLRRIVEQKQTIIQQLINKIQSLS